MSCSDVAAARLVALGYDVLTGGMPEFSEKSLEVFRDRCAKNLCGSYGRSWSCPPGQMLTLRELGSRFDSVLVVRRTFVMNPRDEASLRVCSDGMKADVRDAVASIRSYGGDCIGVSDGKCGYCGECSYPEPCAHPDQLLPSASAVGIDLGAYLASLGELFSFENNMVTLYALIMYSSRP